MDSLARSEKENGLSVFKTVKFKKILFFKDFRLESG